jgi:hypothetical protein
MQIFEQYARTPRSFGVDIKRKRQLGPARTVQLAQDRLGDVADLWCRAVRVESDLGIEASGSWATRNSNERGQLMGRGGIERSRAAGVDDSQ